MICSGFVRVFPCKIHERQHLYQQMIDYSKSSFNEFTSVHNTRMQPSAFVRADPRNMSRTNPQPIKGKSTDLIQSNLSN